MAKVTGVRISKPQITMGFKTSTSGPTYYFDIEFIPKESSQIVTASVIAPTENFHEIGSLIPILYDRRSPETVQSSYIWTWFYYIPSLAFIILATFLFLLFVFSVQIALPKSENDTLVKFIDYFSQKNQFYQITNSASLQTYNYSKEVYQFLDWLQREGLLDNELNLATFESKAKEIMNDSEYLKKINLETLKKLLTFHLRCEKFSNGHLATIIDSKHLVNCLKRLEQLFSK